VLRDLIKLENDLLYLWTPLEDDDALIEALRITAALRRVEDLRAPLTESIQGVERPALRRAWAVIRFLRSVAARVCVEDRHPWQVSVGLLRYAVHTLSFDEAGPLQKRWALAAASGLAEDLVRHFEAERLLRPGWVDLDGCGLPEGAGVGVVICPGRRDRGRDLDEDLDALVACGTTALIGLITDPELAVVGVPDLPARARSVGIDYTLLRVPDQRVPTLAEAQGLVDTTLTRLQRGERIVFHCLGGLGRSGTLAACVVAALGVAPEQAVARVRAARGPRALETRMQQDFVAELQGARAG
jgi:protein-tyrosine phosphatase